MPAYLDPDGFAEWEARVPASFRRDPIWRTPAYRYGVWLADLVKQDVRSLRGNPDFRNVAEQLVRSVEGISANLAEGYSCRTGAARARYYGYALATTREARDWYLKARDALGAAVVEQRFATLERIVRILTAVVPRERSDRSHLRVHRRSIGDEIQRPDRAGDDSSSS